MTEPYVLEFEVKELPKTPNALLGAPWRIRAGHAKHWERIVWLRVWHLRPPAPLLKAKLTFTRCSSHKLDYGGLVGSFKAVEDALVKNKIILDDCEEIVGVPTFLHEKAKQKEGKIKVRVEEIIQTKENT